MEEYVFHKWWLKDSRTTAFVVGIILPILFLAWGIVNVLTGTVYWPADHFRGNAADGLLICFTDNWRVWGLAAVRWGIAGGFFSWYGLANFERTEHWTYVGLAVSAVPLFAGFLAFAIGYFV